MLKEFAYSLVLGKPIVVWLGLTALALFASALFVIGLNNYTRIRIPIEWHNRLAIAGMAIVMIHAILAISAYI